MNTNEYLTPAEMKAKIGLKANSKDNRTLNKYVADGKLEIMVLSKRIKLYRFISQYDPKKEDKFSNDDWVIEKKGVA